MDYFLYALIGIPAFAVVYGFLSKLFGSEPTKEQLQVRANINLYEQMSAYRQTLVQTGTAKQLEEFDMMFAQVKEILPEEIRKWVDITAN